MDEDFIVNETHQSDSRNYIELNESSSDEKIMTCVERKFLKNIILSLLLVNVFK